MASRAVVSVILPPRVRVRATREVILCGGAVNSPQILQLSGIGPAGHVAGLGLPVVHDLPGVGANLSDHYVTRITHRVRDAISLNELSRGWRVLPIEAAATELLHVAPTLSD